MSQPLKRPLSWLEIGSFFLKKKQTCMLLSACICRMFPRFSLQPGVLETCFLLVTKVMLVVIMTSTKPTIRAVVYQWASLPSSASFRGVWSSTKGPRSKALHRARFFLVLGARKRGRLVPRLTSCPAGSGQTSTDAHRCWVDVLRYLILFILFFISQKNTAPYLLFGKPGVFHLLTPP